MKTLEGLMMRNYRGVFYLREAIRHDTVEWGRWPAAKAGLTFRKMMKTTEGRDAYCVWQAIWRLVTREKSIGVCKCNGQWITADDIELDTSLPIRVVVAGFIFLTAAGWLEPVPKPGEKPASDRAETGGTPGRSPGYAPNLLAGAIACASESSSPSGSSSDSGGGLGEPANARPRAQFSGQWDNGTLFRVYQAYPKKTGRSPAMRAIDAALCKLTAEGNASPVEWLTGRVEMYAVAVKGQPQQFIPHPGNWFSDERYHDDEAAWKRDGADSDGPTKAIGKGGF